ncbi:hypothetical protein AJ85_01825 [Alkalihalobacillus alcalophilus ATCC 27647 = CGMCC 1.3604]|uniref:Sporulation protein Spo0E n=1 Tax=Alkalihalobacillus alcalophilus ATCC 27647 = CGMCC 1.3604 TaxID=1218173 RepID=A0A4S4K2B1_ALKAL|nr:aspartyl-phosphate phosphatase Spo0E family protein [Alkalihalobacillus alcalophilus]MED1561190.1 aspartyl-phosphate phosphatase Spo0E family protein [Alkalihalobacillus alcalophilus]THG91784.1 hypothetical protein AJ85_01825 [Alkalihalobacillus alcalophilus ATCC 27647 = CGMCC 1.3604]
MKKYASIDRLLNDIEKNRDKLNKLALESNLQSNEVISCSQQLDVLIHQYQSMVQTRSS